MPFKHVGGGALARSTSDGVEVTAAKQIDDIPEHKIEEMVLGFGPETADVEVEGEPAQSVVLSEEDLDKIASLDDRETVVELREGVVVRDLGAISVDEEHVVSVRGLLANLRDYL